LLLLLLRQVGIAAHRGAVCMKVRHDQSVSR
jgi:hypothetical protein